MNPRRNITPEVIADMRAWIADCPWAECPFGDSEEVRAMVAELSDYAVLRGVERHYAGGILAFIDAEYPVEA